MQGGSAQHAQRWKELGGVQGEQAQHAQRWKELGGIQGERAQPVQRWWDGVLGFLVEAFVQVQGALRVLG